MKPWWVTWYESPRASAWQLVDDVRAWETGWRWCDGHVRCAAVVFAESAEAVLARVQELVAGSVEWVGRPVLMDTPPPNNFRGAERWWDVMTARRAA